MSERELWGLIVAIGVATFLLRVSFIALLSGRQVPLLVTRALRFVPAAVLAALVLPAVTYRGGVLALTPDNGRLLAALGASLVAWRTRSIPATIAAGMALLWLQTLLVAG